MISIVIPLYNKCTTIARTIDSVITQTYKEWELLIIDDGSTDGSSEVVARYLDDSRIKYFRKPNGGVATARNMGIQQAIGEWITYIDADDYFLSNALESLMQMTVKYLVDIVTGNYYIETAGNRKPYLHNVKEGIVANNFRYLFFGSFDIRAGATLYKSSLIKLYRFDEKLTRYEDAKLEFDILRNNKVAITPEFMMIYTQDFSGLSCPCSNFSKDFISCMSFESKPFWEKMFLGLLIVQGLTTYPDKRDDIKLHYKSNLKWMYFSLIIYYLIRLRNKVLTLVLS